MIKKHLKRLTMPRTWQIKRKGITFITRPNPGKLMEYSMPLNVIFRDVLGIAKTTREIKYLLHEKEILVDAKKRKDVKYPIGFMDVITFPETKENFRVLLSTKGKITTIAIDEKEAKFKVLKIIGKTKVKKKTQLNLFDSRNILVEKDEFKVGDSIVMELESQKIKSTLKLEKGAYAILMSGKYGGLHGVVENIADNKIIINLSDGNKIETSNKYAYVIGKNKSEIKLPE